MNPIVKSYHTHAGGEDNGWFGAGIHPAMFDSVGKLIDGTEWRVSVDHAYTLLDTAEIIDYKVKKELKMRVEVERTCKKCQVVVPCFIINTLEPVVEHPKKATGNHKIIYD